MNELLKTLKHYREVHDNKPITIDSLIEILSDEDETLLDRITVEYEKRSALPMTAKNLIDVLSKTEFWRMKVNFYVARILKVSALKHSKPLSHRHLLNIIRLAHKVAKEESGDDMYYEYIQ